MHVFCGFLLVHTFLYFIFIKVVFCGVWMSEKHIVTPEVTHSSAYNLTADSNYYQIRTKKIAENVTYAVYGMRL